MIGKSVKRIFIFVLFALIGYFAYAGASVVSVDEKGQKTEIVALDDLDADDYSLSPCLLSADEPFIESTSVVRVVRPPQPFNTTSLSGHTYTLIRSCHSVVWQLRALLLWNLGRHISSCRYAHGYYIYHLCRMLI